MKDQGRKLTVSGSEIVKGRYSAGLTQKALADKAGVSRRTIQHAEEGSHLSPTTLKKIAGALSVTVESLLSFDNRYEVKITFTDLGIDKKHDVLNWLEQKFLEDEYEVTDVSEGSLIVQVQSTLWFYNRLNEMVEFGKTPKSFGRVTCDIISAVIPTVESAQQQIVTGSLEALASAISRLVESKLRAIDSSTRDGDVVLLDLSLSRNFIHTAELLKHYPGGDEFHELSHELLGISKLLKACLPYQSKTGLKHLVKGDLVDIAERVDAVSKKIRQHRDGEHE